mgnify:CR=1 FL=1
MAVASIEKVGEDFKNYRLEGELARRVQEVAKIVEAKNGKLTLDERKKLCYYIADAARDWRDPYKKMICDNLDFVVDKAQTQREVWYRGVSVAPPEIYKFIEEKAKVLKRGWADCYDRVVYYFLQALEAAGLADMKEERPTELIYIPERSEPLTLRQFVKWVERQGKTIEEVLRSYKLIIYVEKQHIAQRIVELRELGIAIITGKGFPTRHLRKIAKYGKLVVLVDADKSGGDIFYVFKRGSKRHRKIGGEQYARKYMVPGAIIIGLTEEDAKKLGLFPIPETPRRKKQGYLVRYELDALSALEAKGIENPYLAYVVAKLKLLGFELKIRLPSDDKALGDAVEIVLSRSIRPYISKISKEVAKKVVEQGTSIKEDDFTIREDVLREAVQHAVQRLKEELMRLKELEIEMWDVDRKIKFVPDEVHTVKDYEEWLIRSSGADKIIKMLSS